MTDADAPEPTADHDVVRRDFNTGFRGFDSAEVIAHLEQVAARLRSVRDGEQSWKARAAQLEMEVARLRSESAAAASAASEPPALDEDAMLQALGVETANILRRAHEAASQVQARAEAEAAGVVQAAHDDAARVRLQAEGVLSTWTREAEARAARIVADAERDGNQVRARAEAEAADIVEQGRVRGREMIRDAQMTKEGILGDLLRRRKVAQVQIEQLRAGRERLLEAYRTVRRTLDEVTDELQRADAEARMAAEVVGRRAAMDAAAAGGSGSTSAASAAAPAPPPSAAPVARRVRPRPERREPRPEPEPEPEPEPPPEPPPSALDEPPEVVPEDRPLSAVRILRPSPPDHEDVDEDVESVRVIRPEDEETEAPEAVAAETDEVPEEQEESVEEQDWLEEVVETEPQVVIPEAPVVHRPAVDEMFARLRAERESPVESTAQAASTDEAPASDDDLIQQRNAVVHGIEDALTRKLKRALQDEQNDLLDRLRGLSRPVEAALLLPSLAAQAERYRVTSMPFLSEAAEAGGGFYPGGTADEVRVDDIAEQLAADLAGPLRRRLEAALADAGGEDMAAVADHIGAAYREWKTQRIEQVAGDHVNAAFAIGVLTSAPAGSSWQWVVDDRGGPCPDCDDNALAGPTPRGEVFPTGQPHPPAHAGCRCLLVPARR